MKRKEGVIKMTKYEKGKRSEGVREGVAKMDKYKREGKERKTN